MSVFQKKETNYNYVGRKRVKVKNKNILTANENLLPKDNFYYV